MRWIALTLLPAFVFTTSQVATAHPGHGTTDPASVAHQVVEPVHALPWMLLAGVLITLVGTGLMLWRNRRQHARAVARTRTR